MDYGPDHYSYRRFHFKKIVWSVQPDSDIKPNIDASCDILRVRLQLDTTYKFPSKPLLKYIEVSSKSTELVTM